METTGKQPSSVDKLKMIDRVIVDALRKHDEILNDYIKNVSLHDYDANLSEHLQEFLEKLYEYTESTEDLIAELEEKYYEIEANKNRSIADCCNGNIDDTIRTMDRIINQQDNSITIEPAPQDQYLEELKKMGY